MSALKKSHIILLITMLTLVNAKQASAQLAGLQSIYFQNQYLANPAMAGVDKGLNLNMGYQHQWTNLPGGPRMQDFTADYNSGNRVGLGFIINSDDAGLISRTRIMGTYAYHLPVSETGKLNFGLSFGMNDSYVDYSKVSGDPGDISVSLFNQRRIYLDGDLGIAYTSNHFNIQAVLPNVGSVLFNTENDNLDVDRATFYTAVSYQYQFEGYTQVMIEPKLAYRGIKGFQNIADVGGNITMNDYYFNIMALYHSNKSFTTGVGINLKPVCLSLSYTGNSGPLQDYANNTFEVGIKYVMFNRSTK